MLKYVEQKVQIERTLNSFNEILAAIRQISYTILPPETVVFDLDTTHLDTHGQQELAAYCTHYKSVGYHPFVMYDAITRDCIKVALRPGSEYCSKHAADFLEPVFQEFAENYPDTRVVFRGDSGFAAPEIYELCEKYGVNYIIRLKENDVLNGIFQPLINEVYALMKDDCVTEYRRVSDAEYKAKSWSHPRRAICEVYKAEGNCLLSISEIVTNIPAEELSEETGLELYRGRGIMETFIGECKLQFGFTHVSSRTFFENCARLQIHALAYQLFNLFLRMNHVKELGNSRAVTVRRKLFKVNAKVVHHAREMTFHVTKTYPDKVMFEKVFNRIDQVSSETMELLKQRKRPLSANKNFRIYQTAAA